MGNIRRKINNLYRFFRFYKVYRKDQVQKNYFDRQLLVYQLGVQKDEFVFLSSTGIGDLYLKLILINGLKKTLNTNKISVGYLKPKHIGVINLFKESIYKIYKLNEKEIEILSEKSGKPSLGCVSHPFSTINTFQSIGYNSFNFLDLIKLQFNIPLEFNDYIIPIISDETENIVIEKMNQLGIEMGNAILISPNAATFKPLNLEFWINLVEKLLQANIKILILDNTDFFRTHSNENLICIDFPLEESISICNYCGGFIGYRSGFCDLIQSSSAKKIIIYPEIETDYFDSKKGFSFSEMGFSNTNDLFEITYNENNQDESINKINKFITN